jgi:hypothetical protein
MWGPDKTKGKVEERYVEAPEAHTFTEEEMRNYNPQPCPTCGQPSMQYEFEDTHDSHGLPVPLFTLKNSVCTNENCASNGGPEGPGGTERPPGSDGAVV